MAEKETMKESLVDRDSPSDVRRKRRSSLIMIISGLIIVFFFTFTFVLYLNGSILPRTINIYIRISRINDSVITKVPETPACALVADVDKFDCYPDAPVTEEQCMQRGCCFHVVEGSIQNSRNFSYPPLGIPYCYYPKDFQGYKIKQTRTTEGGINAVLERVLPSGFPHDVQEVHLDITNIDENTLRILMTDKNSKRHEAPLKQPVLKKTLKTQLAYNVTILSNGILSVTRKSTGTIIFTTDLRRLVYSDQFLQLSTQLPTHFIYGLGEHYDRFLKDVYWTRTPLFNRDNWPRPDVLLYGTHPFYIGLEKDHYSHGVFLLNSNSIDVVLQPTPAITFRPIGGVLDFFIFLGPSPDEVVQQYTKIVQRPAMPPYWSLGFHLCKYGYGSLNETEKVWQRTREAGIPYDAQWNDIDYMDKHNDFTYDKVNYSGLPDFVEMLHENDMHYVIIIDPGISNAEKPGSYAPYDDGLKEDLFVKNMTGGIFIGKVWNSVSTVFPDFSHPAAPEYWKKQFKSFHDLVPFDGAWIDMNEPSNFFDGGEHGCPDTNLDNPPYVPGGLEPLRTHTLCMSAKHYYTTHYNEHSLYSFRESFATYRALVNITQKRPFIISRASFPGQGQFSGHWSGDIGSNWDDLRYSIVDLLNFNMFGFPMMGSDICGFRDDTTVELCARWSAVGAFYPFSRNHNDVNQRDQDPVALGDVVVRAARNALITRYRLLPYLYYLFFESHVYGKTVARPLVFEFANDPDTYAIDEQFMWGSALMIMPALYQGVTNISVYFPNAVWFDFYTGEKLNVSGQQVTLPAPFDKINLAFRGGYVIPQQYHNETTTKSRQNKFFLLAALDQNGQAAGHLYWDDGKSLDTYEEGKYNLINFDIANNTLVSFVANTGYSAVMDLDVVKICGFDASPPSEVTVDGRNATYEFDKYNCLNVDANVSLLHNFVIQWN